MHRMACINVDSFVLQLLLQRHLDWSDQPVAVVSEDKPPGTVVAVNQPALAAGVREGMRYTAALSLVECLQADTVSSEEVTAGVRLVIDRLLSISPSVEGSEPETGDNANAYAKSGVFWMDASGLRRHHRSPAALAQTIQRCLSAEQFKSTVVIGYTRFGTYLLARDTPQGCLVVPGAANERRAARKTPIERLPLKPAIRDLLEKLDINTVDDFLRLPYADLLRRFGDEVAAVHRFVRSDLDLPVQGNIPASRFLHRDRLSHSETDVKRLQQHAERLLNTLLDHLQTENRTAEELQLRLFLEDGSYRQELIRPATPTNEQRQLVDLLALRLRALNLSSGVEELCLDAAHVPTHATQASLFRVRKQRDLAAGSEALAHIRAQFGNQTVANAVVTEAHLPEMQFFWQPASKLALPQPRASQDPKKYPPKRWLIRRVLKQPSAAPPPKSVRHGPFLISSGWWNIRDSGLSCGVDRAYYFISSSNGALKWVYYDRINRRWYLQGWVE